MEKCKICKGVIEELETEDNAKVKVCVVCGCPYNYTKEDE